MQNVPDTHNKSAQRASAAIDSRIVVYAVMLVVIFVAILLRTSQIQYDLVRFSTERDARTIANLIYEVRGLYSKQVVSRLKGHGITAQHDYANEPRSIPLPATFALELAERLNVSGADEISFNLYSPYPFPWRQHTGGIKDDFQEQAWKVLNKSPSEIFSRIETNANSRTLRLAIADVMQESCVECHNHHPESPKTDWRAGDVRGILEVQRSLNMIAVETEKMLSGLSYILLFAGIITFLFVVWMVRHNRNLTGRLLIAAEADKRSRAELENHQKQLLENEKLLIDARLKSETINKELYLKAAELELGRLSTLNLLQDFANEKERAQQANAAKGIFLSTMSHEIRTPLNGMLGMAQILEQTELDEIQQRYLKMMSESGESLLSIINDMLEYSNLDNDDTVLDCIDFDLQQLVYAVCRLMFNTALEKSIQLALHYHVDCPRYVRGDPGHIRKVLLKLVSNAIKFTEQGHVLLEIQLLNSLDGKLVIKFSVHDTGIGIASVDQKNLFEAFTQADSSTTRQYGGTGLGLAICQRIVDKLGGRIYVDSAPQRGSCFWFELILPSAELQPPLAACHQSNVNVMLLASQVLMLDILKQNLQKMGMVVTCSESLQQGLQQLHHIQSSGSVVELIVIDPDGLEESAANCVSQLRECSAPQNIPILMFSQLGEEHSHDVQQWGADAILPKPFQVSALQSVLLDLLASNSTSNHDLDNVTNLGLTPFFEPHNYNIPLLSGLVLVVDDDSVSQVAIATMLDAMGLRHDVTADAEQAVSLYQGRAYDLVIMACHMAVLDGYHATQRIRNTQRDRRRRVPIIALASQLREEERQRCLEAGMDDMILKPIEPAIFNDKLQKWLHLSEVDEKSTFDEQSVDQLRQSNNVKHGAEITLKLDDALDIRKLNQLRALLEGNFQTLLDSFVEGSNEYIIGLKQALNNNDQQAMIKYAHTLKGMSGNVGAKQVFERAQRLETQAQEGMQQPLADPLRELEQIIKQTQALIVSHFSLNRDRSA